MARTWRTLVQSIVSPVVSTSLYFVVFRGRDRLAHHRNPGRQLRHTFIVPGLVMLSVLTQSIANGLVRHLFSEIRAAPSTKSCRRRWSYFEIVLGYVGAAATKSIILGLIILATAGLFCAACTFSIRGWMLTFLVLTAVTFSLFGFIIGIWADGFEKLADDPDAGGDAADLSRRQLLLGQHAAVGAGAPSRCLNPVGLSDLGLPLEAFTRSPTSAWP